jgi:hypothetical protein
VDREISKHSKERLWFPHSPTSFGDQWSLSSGLLAGGLNDRGDREVEMTGMEGHYRGKKIRIICYLFVLEGWFHAVLQCKVIKDVFDQSPI